MYSFTADTSNTGLPKDGVTYAWSVNDNPIGTGSSTDYLFAKANTQYRVSLSTKIGDNVIGTNSIAVTTGKSNKSKLNSNARWSKSISLYGNGQMNQQPILDRIGVEFGV